MVRRTHQSIWIVFTLFVAYLVLVRLFISWAQLAPGQVTSVVGGLTNSEISFSSLQIEQNWLGVEIEAQELLVEYQGVEFEVERLVFDFNLFSPLLPNVSWGDHLIAEQPVLLEYRAAVSEETLSQSYDSLLTLNSEELSAKFDISRLWKKIDISDFSGIIYQNGVDWKINVDRFQAFKGARWSLAADLNLHHGQVLQGERFQFKASLLPNLFGGIEQGDFSIQAYDSIRLQRLAKLTPKKWQEVLPDGQLIPSVKGALSNSLLSSLNIKLFSDNLQWPVPSQSLPQSLGVGLEWHNQAKIYDGSQTDWQFLLKDIQLDNHYVQTVSPISVKLVSKQFLHIETQRFNIAPFKPMFHAVTRNENVAKLFDASVELNIHNVVADLVIKKLYFENLSMDIDKLAIPVTDLPGIAAERVHIEKQNTALEISSKRPIWVMHPLIHEVPMSFELQSPFSADLDIPNQQWSLKSLSLLWDQMPVSVSGRGDLSGALDIQAEIDAKTVHKVKQYLPYESMTDDLQAWLKSALVAGEVGQGRFYFKGDLDDYPFDSGSTRFGGSLAVKNFDLQFQPNWPQLQNFDAQLEWSNFDLTVRSDELALAKGVEAKEVVALISQLDSRDIAVDVSAAAEGQADAVIDYLLTTPLPKKIGVDSFIADKSKLSLDGALGINFKKIWVPVNGYEDKEVELDGELLLKDNQVTLYEYLSFEHVSGLLKFSEESVKAENIRTQFEEGVAKFDVDTKKGAVTILGSGAVNLDYPAVVKGSADWKVKVDIPLQAATEQGLVLKSQLDTSELDWLMPAPLNNKNLRGEMDLNLATAQEQIDIKGQLAGFSKFDLKIDNSSEQMKVSQGSILIGSIDVAKVKHQDGGVTVRGLVENLDLDEWLRWNSPLLDGDSENGLLKGIVWSESSIEVEELKLIEHTYKELVLDWVSENEDGYRAKLSGAEVSASLLAKNSDSVDVQLDWLQLYMPESLEDSSLTQQQRQELIENCKLKTVALNTWPDVTFSGKNIRIDDIGVAELAFKVEDSLQELHFKNIKAVLEDKAGTLTGEYLFHKQPKLSSANIKLNSSNVKNLTKLIGLKQGFSGKKAEVKSNVVWFGGLECFNLLGLLGKTDYKVEDGVIENVEPGFARLLGLLNVTSLARRLSLNLKDVTTKGLVYDQITGETHFIEGGLYFKNFKLKAPSVSVELKGEADLIEQSFNLKAGVTPALGGSLPALSAITGVATPLGALAIYTLMKVIPEINEDLVTYQYKVTGPWKDPVIEGLNKEQIKQPQDQIEDILNKD